MRNYKTDSPQAAARIVAVTLVSDGHVSKTELELLDRIGIYRQLGLDKPEMLSVLQAFCDDLLQARHPDWAGACQIDPKTLTLLMAEVEDPELRMTVLRMCVAITEVDSHIADGESIVLVSAAGQWGLHYETLQPAAPA